jgi:hypothetical protein
VAASNSFVIGGTGTEAVNVGINTTTPTEKLYVNGAIKMADGGYTGVTIMPPSRYHQGEQERLYFTKVIFMAGMVSYGNNWITDFVNLHV